MFMLKRTQNFCRTNFKNEISVLNNEASLEMNKLIDSISFKSKHSNYQLLHPLLQSFVDLRYRPVGMYESHRQVYMEGHVELSGKRILDIGANTGYFSFAAIEAGASNVLCIEGNAKHANFIKSAAGYLNFHNQVEVRSEYYNFDSLDDEHFDVILCLNVLHHLGDDFGDKQISIEEAKVEIIHSLNLLASKGDMLWVQLGFNWKGDSKKPLFKNGTKAELIDFVRLGTADYWDVKDIAVVDPFTMDYCPINAANFQRIDKLGEFLNRPLFLLSSK